MLPFCLSAIAGAVICSQLAALPSNHVLLLAVLTAGLLLRRPAGQCVAALLCGFAFFGWSAASALEQRLARDLHRTNLRFTAEIIDFPKVKDGNLSLLVRTRDGRLPARMRLSWYRTRVSPRLGETWDFTARLSRPRGARNPGGFDYEGWLHRERIGASGYILSGQPMPPGKVSPFVWLRLHAADRMVSLLPEDAARAALLAIAIGARQDITAASWERYAATGTTHLMAISGLHVGLAATATALFAWFVSGVLCPSGNLRDRALLLAAPVAALYAAVSGFGIPSRRAVLMTVCVVCSLLLRRTHRAPDTLAIVAIIVLLADPLALLSPGFLLSFAAVAVLIQVGAERRGHHPPGARVMLWFRELGHLQAALLFGLLPLTALLFARTAWLAPVANLLVLPLFSCVTVPAALLGLILDGPLAAAGDLLLRLAWLSLRATHWLIDGLAAIPGSRLPLPALSGAARALLVIPVLWLLPAGVPGRRLAILSFAALLLYRPPPPPDGCVELQALDVGQGLAVFLRTREHTLLYDTGPAYPGGSSSAERVVLPFLNSRRVRALDALVVSHADQDHAGGASYLLDALPVGHVLAGETLPDDRAQLACNAGQRWLWDDVQFDVLYPATGSAGGGNNSSCVLRVRAGRASILLTGDIEASAERALLHAGVIHNTSLVLVPHHGSRTSSTAAFVNALQAEVAIVSAGFENRWGFPKADVVARWTAAGSRLMNTAESGAISFRACADGELTLLGEYRRQAQRYWHEADL